jgi:hypothetical protein
VLGSVADRSRTQAVVAIGKISAAIVKLARAHSVDLIVMGVSGQDTADVALLGSNTHHASREGTWPLLNRAASSNTSSFEMMNAATRQGQSTHDPPREHASTASFAVEMPGRESQR